MLYRVLQPSRPHSQLSTTDCPQGEWLSKLLGRDIPLQKQEIYKSKMRHLKQYQMATKSSPD